MSNSRLLDHYNQRYQHQNDDYPAIAQRRFPRNRYEAVLKHLQQGQSVLDIGTGRAEFYAQCPQAYGHWTLAEFSPSRLDYLRQKFSSHNHVDIMSLDIENDPAPFPSASFDTILFNAVVEHLVDPIIALQKIHDMLTPQGRLIITTPNIAKWTRRLKLLAGRFPATASINEGLTTYAPHAHTDLHDEGHLHYFTFRSLSLILTQRVGFQQVHRQGFGRPSFLASMCPTLFGDILLVAVKA